MRFQKSSVRKRDEKSIDLESLLSSLSLRYPICSSKGFIHSWYTSSSLKKAQPPLPSSSFPALFCLPLLPLPRPPLIWTQRPCVPLAPLFHFANGWRTHHHYFQPYSDHPCYPYDTHQPFCEHFAHVFPAIPTSVGRRVCILCSVNTAAVHGGYVTVVVERVNTNTGSSAILTTPATSATSTRSPSDTMSLCIISTPTYVGQRVVCSCLCLLALRGCAIVLQRRTATSKLNILPVIISQS